MYDRLVNESPMLKRMRAESKAEGELQTAKQMIMDIIEVRFPALDELAQRRIKQITNLEELRRIGRQIAAGSDEREVRHLLEPEVA